MLAYTVIMVGGKIKPLKAPKKDKKDLDEDEVAFKEKQKAGMLPVCPLLFRSLSGKYADLCATTRCQSAEGNDGEGQGQGPYERWRAGY